ncbi:MAG: ABC transporter ATP-binding protein [Patescibacteria group bacterium]
MHDAEDSRKITRNWREYLGETRESYRVYVWVWQELVSAEAKYWYKKMMVGYVFEIGFALIVPLFIAMVINGLVKNDLKTTIIGVTAVLVAFVLERLSAHFVMVCREWILGFNHGTLDQRTSELFFEKSMGQHLQENSVLSSSNVEKGRARVTEMQNMLLFEGVGAMLTLAISLILLMVISLVAGLVMLMILIIIIVWSLYLNQKVVEIMTPLDKEFRALNRHRVERWDEISRVKTTAKEDEEVQTITSWFRRIIEPDRAFWIWYIQNLTGRSIMIVLALVGILSYGAWLVWHGQWEVGILYPLFTWSISVQQNIWRIGHIEHQLNWNMPSVRSLMAALTIRPDIVDKQNAIALSPAEPVKLELRNVTHGYGVSNGEKAKKVLRNISFTVEPGEKVALIGCSGAGKTTIMRAIMRYMDPQKGSILINDHNLQDIQLASWLRLIGYIPQDAVILDGTIRYNLLYGLSEAAQKQISDDDLWALMDKLQIDFGDRLTDGLDTKVGRVGVKLSGGEKQRVMIGAAAIKQPRFMVIDEATSSLDARTERKVHDGLHEVLTPDMGALIITHRLSTVRDICDKFIVLRSTDELAGGDAQVEAIAESFEELYKSSETFRILADEQGVQINA